MKRARSAQVREQRARRLFFSDAAPDKLLAMLLTLSSEVWAMRERLAAWEAIAMRKGTLLDKELDTYEFTPDEQAVLAGQRRDFVASLFRMLEEPSTKRPRRAPRRGAKRKARKQ
jgi:hypothetical protein